MDAQQPAAPVDKPWYKRWWFRALAGIVIFVILLLIALPFAAKYALKRWLEQNGAEQAVVDSLRYNPFLGRASLRGLAVDIGGQTLLSNGVFSIDLGLSRLLSHDIHVEDASYRDLMIDIEQKPDGTWRFGSYSLTANGEPSPARPESQPSKWIVSARNVALAACKVHFKTPELDLTLVVDEARLQGFSTSAAAAPATFHLRGTLNGESVDIQLDAVKIAPSLALNGHLSIAGFDLAIIKKYVEKALPDFAGKASLNGKAAFSLDNGVIKADYDGVIDVAKPSVGNNTFNTAAEDLSWNGAASYHLAKNDSAVTVKGTLASVSLSVAVPGAGFVVKHDKITLAGDCAVPILPLVAAHHDGMLETAGTVVGVRKMKISQQKFNWQGKSDWSMPDGVSRAVFTGALATGRTNYENGEMRAGSEAMTVAELTGDIGTKLAFKSLAANGLSFSTGGKKATSASVEAVGIGAASTDDFINWQTQNISVKKAGAVLPGAMPLKLSLLGLDIDRVSSENAAIWKTGRLRLRNFVANSSRGSSSRLASLGTAKITGITATKKGQAKVTEVDLGDLCFLGFEKKDAISSLDRLRLQQSAFSLKDGFSAASLSLEGLRASLERDKEGNFNVLSRLQAMQKPESGKNAPKTTSVAETPPTKAHKAEASGKAGQKKIPPIRIGKISLDGRILYTDKTLPMDFNADAEIKKLTIENIDSANPDRKTAVTLEAQLAGRAPLEVKGDVALFGDKPDISLDIHLKNYPLSNLSPYTAKAVGTALASGELKVDSTVSLKNDYLKVESKTLLHKLETKTLSPELAAQLNNQLPLPLDAALALLRDNDRNIKLDIPVEGELSSLHVGFSSIVITALSKAIIPAASAYMVYALGPYGALAYVGMKVGQKMMQVSLPPVEFPPGQDSLTLVQDDYLQRIAKILSERPETDLQLTPKVVADELLPGAASKKAAGTARDATTPAPKPLSPEMTKKLEALGQKRAEALRQRLHNQFGVDIKRLMISETQIVPDGKPEVLPSL
ncbi:MAG: DUF748 domain-containing protein [Desulfobulbaceae bacterium]|jgi:hypothetical protein|nr:DUF748 domain-containing protein [Desulfobulbaceae bacterium]